MTGFRVRVMAERLDPSTQSSSEHTGHGPLSLRRKLGKCRPCPWLSLLVSRYEAPPIHAVERSLAFLTLALVGTSLIAFQTRTAPVDTTGSTLTHIATPISSGHGVPQDLDMMSTMSGLVYDGRVLRLGRTCPASPEASCQVVVGPNLEPARNVWADRPLPFLSAPGR